MVIGIDVGYGRTKAFTEMVVDGKRKAVSATFLSVFKKTNDDYIPVNREGCIHIQLDEKKYYVGKEAMIKEGESVFNREDMFRHKIYVLAAIAKIMKGNDFTGNIALGLPIGDMNSLADKLNFLVGHRKIVFNGKECTIDIKKVFVYPQGSTVINEIAAYEQIDNSIVGIIDIGQKTVDVAWYNSLVLVDNRTASYDNLGCSFVFNEISKEIKTKLGYQIPDYQIFDRITHKEELKKIAEPFLKDFAEKIERNIQRLNWNYAELDQLVLVGGGAALLEKYLSEKIPIAKLHKNAIFANACGFFEKGVKDE